MKALVSLGEPARALAHFETMSAVLQREVGAKPAAETRELAEQIRRERCTHVKMICPPAAIW